MATATIVELDESNTCKICDNALAKYSCPKCNILYCSLECYRHVSHLDCAEAFYKANVLEELSTNATDAKEGPQSDAAKMMDILQRIHENNKIILSDYEEEELDSDDEVTCEDIAARLAGIDLDNADQVWDILTENEKQDFVAFLKSEDVTKLIPSWQPWWLYRANDLVTDLESREDYKKNCPQIPHVKNISEITSKKPAKCVRHNLENILAAYVFTVRYFNGEHFEYAREAASCIVSLSLTLKCGQNFQDFETAVKSMEQECLNVNWILKDEENINNMHADLEMVLHGPNAGETNYYVMCALADLHALLMKAVALSNSDTSGGNSAAGSSFSKLFPDQFPNATLEPVDTLKNCAKKIEYYLSYSKDCFLIS